MDAFFLLAIQVFGCFHQQVNNFFHQCANMAWTTKGTGGPLLSLLCSFYKQRVLMALQKIQVASILRHVVIAREGFFKLRVLLNLPLLFLVDMFHVTSGGFSFQWLPFLLVAFLFWAICLPRLQSLALFFSSPFLRCFLFIKFGRVSSIECLQKQKENGCFLYLQHCPFCLCFLCNPCKFGEALVNIANCRLFQLYISFYNNDGPHPKFWNSKTEQISFKKILHFH